MSNATSVPPGAPDRRCDSREFGGASVTIRNHALALPDDPELIDELANLRLRETASGVLRIDHDPDKHDDPAIALGLAAHRLAQVTWAQPKAAKDEPPMEMRERAICELVTARDKPRRVIRASITSTENLGQQRGFDERSI